MFCVPFYILALFVGHAFGELNITLWQFGKDHLDDGEFTEPLRPIGVASDGLSTTYVYELLNVQTTATFPGIVPTIKSISRTIVASASGWVELFDSGNLECKFINSDRGKCFDKKFIGTGVPIPVVLTVLATSTSVPAEPTNSDRQSSPNPFPTAGPTTTSQSSPKGAIVGSTIAGLVSVCNVAVLILWLRRRRQRSNPCRFEDCDASQERGKHSRRPRQERLVEPIESQPEETHLPMVNMGPDFRSYINPVRSILDAISTQTEDGTTINSIQPRSKRAQANPFAKGSQALPHQMTVAVDQSIKRRSEELSSIESIMASAIYHINGVLNGLHISIET
ncbi:hypothetical protein BDP27DRAFT_1429774 [Rhodocollybia butyracea]|uniref:Uncharacterized protein n=1 Tax=Rhodocollybia butyracea TaxID=206335 RepID=A0A9P5PCB7_9AGAR|nr:hypothetical protein BDP27DRAFT_1429774 [Rhodocollybia butyracea]